MSASDAPARSQRLPGAISEPVLAVECRPGDAHLAAVLRDLLSTAMHATKAEGGLALVLDAVGWPCHWFVLNQASPGNFVLPLQVHRIVEHGMLGRVMRHAQGEVVEDLNGDARWWDLAQFALCSEPRAALCLPLVGYERVVGIMALVHMRPGHFDPSHLHLLQPIGERAAPYLETARLAEIARHHAEEVSALYEITLNVTADQPLERLLDTIVAQAMDLLRCEGGGLYLWDEDQAELQMVASYDPETDLGGIRLVLDQGGASHVFEAGEPEIWHEYETGGTVSSRLPTQAALAVPLMWQNLPLGVLAAIDRRPGRCFDHRDQRMLTLLANQAAAAIASAQLYEKTARQLQELTFFNQTIQDITATLELDEIFAILTRRIKDLLGIEACSIALVDHETKELVFHVASGGGAETVTGERVPWGEGIVGAAAQAGQAVNVSDVRQDGRFYEEIDKKQASFVTRSILAVPMISQGQVVGVVEALNKPGGFDGEDERLLGTLAGLAASVVENAKLVSTRRDLEQLRESLVHMIVHDLRSPVGTISNSLELLSRLVEDGEAHQARHLIGIAARANQRLLNLVDSLLDIGRLESGQALSDLQPTSIKDLIQSAAEQMGWYAQRKRMELHVECAERLPFVLGDAGMLERVLVNLIGNALKFTPAGGKVNIGASLEGETLVVRVRDTGPGIPPQFRHAIFDKFARVRHQEGVGGMGLGLAFCRLAVEAHGGQIWVESAEGEGSTFVFTLPVAEPRGHVRAASSQGRDS